MTGRRAPAELCGFMAQAHAVQLTSDATAALGAYHIQTAQTAEAQRARGRTHAAMASPDHAPVQSQLVE
jgi:hypothetical protein